MNELIKISDYNGKKAVSARDLYDFLLPETPFHKWILRMFEYGFDENKDWTKLSSENQEFKYVYVLSIDCAKEISMIQRTERGKQARLYFIAMEKIALQPKQLSRKELALMVIEAENALEIAETKVKELAPKADVYEQISDSTNLLDGNRAAKALGIGRNKLYAILREKNIFIHNNTPMQRYIDSGYFKVKIVPFKRGEIDTSYPQTYFTGKGIEWLCKLINTNYL